MVEPQRYSPDVYYPDYPIQPAYNPNCSVNVRYKTLPQEWPRQTVPYGPTQNMKLYTGIPNWYPPQYIAKPCDTMYGADLSMYGPFGNLISRHFKAYPLTHRYVREETPYGDFMEPSPTIYSWTKYPVITQGYWGK